MSNPLHIIFSVIAWAWRQRKRFFKFGVVGVSGVAINLIAIWLCKNKLFSPIPSDTLKLNLAMAVGIALGMTNNFYWNRTWTWRDRGAGNDLPVVAHYTQYATANSAGIIVQIVLTNIFVMWLPDLLANAAAIAFACVVNFVLNDLWTFRHVRTEGIDPEANSLHDARIAIPLTMLSLLLATSTYVYGLNSINIVRNGDEAVYMQITRVTAATGHWLPLASEMAEMRNTKPPLLFWQGILSTEWGRDWTLLSLRWPSVAFTFATAGLVGVLAWRVSGQKLASGMLAALVYLAFFSTYRYGRPFLTNAPETFWVFAIFFTMLWWRPRSFQSRIQFPIIIGVITGIALLTKSFAQLVPIGVGLAWWHASEQGWQWRVFVRRSMPSLAIIAIISIVIFSLWFALDPQPREIWREFVVGENIGKIGSGFGTWLQGLLLSADSVWTLAGSWFLNAGLLAFPLFGVMVESWKHRRTLRPEERLLWIWVFAIFIVFCLPNQRSGRYLLEAMPALAVLFALRWRDVGRNAFVLSLIASGLVMLALGWLSFHLAMQLGFEALPWWLWPLLVVSLAFTITAIIKPNFTVLSVAPATMLVYLLLSAFLSVFDPPLANFDQQAQDTVAGHRVWVPSGFRADFEMHRFSMPQATLIGFDRNQQPDHLPPAALCKPDDFVIVERTIDEPAPTGAISSRIEMRGRHTNEQILQIAKGHVRELLFCKEWLVPASALPR